MQVAEGVKSAAQVLGYTVKVIDGQSQPQVWNQAIRTAVTDQSSGIILAGVPPTLVASALASAKQHKIPVATVLSVLGSPTEVRVNYDRAGVASATSAYIAKDSGGKASVAVATDPSEFPETLPTDNAYATLLPQYCTGCSVATKINFTLGGASTKLASNVAEVLQSNAQINYIVVPFDAVVPFVTQGIAQAGRTGKVRVIGVGALPSSIQAIKAGSMTESLGTPTEWMGWDAVDGLVRIFAGSQPPTADENLAGGGSNYTVPMRLIDKTDLPTTADWQGGFDFQAKYKGLWGV